MITSIVILLIGLGSLLGVCILILKIIYSYRNAPKLINDYKGTSHISDTSLTIIIPAYNEQINIESCLLSILNSAKPCIRWKVILVDDESTDNTRDIALKLKDKLKSNSNIFEIISSGNRPKDEKWVGKNWACSTGYRKSSKDDWILFLDADVVLTPYAIRRALNQAVKEKCDLLSLAPKVSCNCLAEWLVQPIMAGLLTIGFPILDTNNPNNKQAFAAGPFMLFRRTSYEEIGGHSGVAAEVVEDLELARKIKASGFKLRFLMGIDALDLNMYSDISKLWEGWTKNWFLGLDRNIVKAISGSVFVLWIFTLPWVSLLYGIYSYLITDQPQIEIFIILLSLVNIGLLFRLRLLMKKKFNLAERYWWLMWAGGIIVFFLGPTSILKTITGLGWTWKGRKLA